MNTELERIRHHTILASAHLEDAFADGWTASGALAASELEEARRLLAELLARVEADAALNAAHAAIAENGWIVGPRFKPGVAEGIRNGYLIYADWQASNDSHYEIEPDAFALGCGATLLEAVQQALRPTGPGRA